MISKYGDKNITSTFHVPRADGASFVVGASGGSRRCTQKFVDSNKKSNLEQIDGIPVLLLVRDVQSTVFPSLMSSETLNCAELHFAVRHWARKLWKKKRKKKVSIRIFSKVKRRTKREGKEGRGREREGKDRPS